MKSIEKLGVAKFKISTPGVNNSDIQLDFNPIIESLSNEEKIPKFYLIHWQGRPKGEREWGIYDPVADSYYCDTFENHLTAYGVIKLIMLDDKTAGSLPSAVIWFSGSLPITGDSL